MIPKQLTLQNFLSYREVVLDFDGLHVACVCGPNGAGKSSLLEAIAWCVWGQSRVNAEDDIVRQGAREAQVSFCFEHDGQTYRIIRTRRRAQASALEFQIQTRSAAQAGPVQARPVQAGPVQAGLTSERGAAFKSLTQKGVRATQQYILRQIKIDYETFVNAAYLRQGRADEFMLKRPSERKQVLADLLKLDHYDRLAEQAKEQARQYKAAIPALETFLEQVALQVDSRAQVQYEYQQLRAQIEEEKAAHQDCQQALERLKQQQAARLALVQQLTQQLALVRQEQQHQQQALTLSQSALGEHQQQLDEVERTLAQAADIEAGYRLLRSLSEQAESQSDLFERYQQLQTERLEIERRAGGQLPLQQLQLSQLKAQLEKLVEKEQEILQVLAKKEELSEKIERLRQAKVQLSQFDKTEAESAPLRQRFLQVQGEIEQAHTRLSTQIELLESQQSEITVQQSQLPELRQAATEVAHKLSHLTQRRAYQEAVRQKGIERRSFMEQLQGNQRNYETQMAQLDQRLQLLEDSEEAHCPLCEQRLDEVGWSSLRDRTQTERKDVQDQIWTIREQLAVSESEIQVLRREYRELEEELASYASILESQGELKAKLASLDELQRRLQTLGEERAQLERCLQENAYATDLQQELQQIEQQLAAMGYDDRDHALVRSQVDRLRWSELKYAEIKRAEKQLAEVREQQPPLVAEIEQVEAALAVLEKSDEGQQLKALAQQLGDLDYSVDRHNQLRAEVREARVWEGRYQALQQARAWQVALLEKVGRSQTLCREQAAELAQINQQVEQLQRQLDEQTDNQLEDQAIGQTGTHTKISDEIRALEQKIATSRDHRERQLSKLGSLQQQLAQLENMEMQQHEQQKKLEDIRHKYQVYRSLAEAFGRNGIQALMIENLLPQLEAMTNQILGRLSNHQLHVQFVTHKLGRQKRQKKKNKLIETLDILIADVRGTRPYETYSGGEAFRVNFAIRLAIARLLAMRSGTALQMLIVDEGFGTQDREGCDRLIAAIEAIAPDFACILTITHMPHFREAFQTRIDVSKDETGSHIVISE